MSRKVQFAFVAALVMATWSAIAISQTAKAPAKAAAAKAAYKAPRNGLWPADIGGFWTNATITTRREPPERPGRPLLHRRGCASSKAKCRTRSAPATAGHRPQCSTFKGGAPASTQGLRAQFDGAGSGVGGYNRGWIDPGYHCHAGQRRAAHLVHDLSGQRPGAGAQGGAAAAPARPAGETPRRARRGRAARGRGGAARRQRLRRRAAAAAAAVAAAAGGRGARHDNPENARPAPSAASCRSAATPARRCCRRLYNNNYQIVQCQGRASPSRSRWSTTRASSA